MFTYGYAKCTSSAEMSLPNAVTGSNQPILVKPSCGGASSTNREPLPRTTAGFGGAAIDNKGAAFGGALTVTGSLGLLLDLLVAPLFADVVTEDEFKDGNCAKLKQQKQAKLNQKRKEVKAESDQHAGSPSHEVVDTKGAWQQAFVVAFPFRLLVG